MAKLVNRAKMTTATTGTGTITLGSAVAGFQTFDAAGAVSTDVVRYVIEDGSAWEIGQGTFTQISETKTLTRTLLESSTGSLLDLSGSAVVFGSAVAEDIGDVTGPASATDNAIARFDATTGKLLQNSALTITDVGDINSTADIEVSTTGTEVAFTQTGDTFGGTSLKIQNRSGVNGAIFEQSGSVDLVDFVFKSLTDQQNIRLESRAGSTDSGQSEFQIGDLAGTGRTLSISPAGIVVTGTANVSGVLTILTAAPGTNTTQAASTAFVTAAVAAAGGAGVDLQTFTSSGTWTKPAGVTFVAAFCVGGGGGGGGGVVSASAAAGGGGGGGGAYNDLFLPASFFAATESVAVGSGGAGGAVNASGSSGGSSRFATGSTYSLLSGGGSGGSSPGNGGVGGGDITNVLRDSTDTTLRNQITARGQGGLTAGTTSNEKRGGYSMIGGGGGGAGVADSPGSPGGSSVFAGAGGGGGGSNHVSIDAGGQGGTSGSRLGSSGGSGGAGVYTTGTATAGGDAPFYGGGYGGGGGGGGSASTGGTAAAGGAGADGIVIVLSW